MDIDKRIWLKSLENKILFNSACTKSHPSFLSWFQLLFGLSLWVLDRTIHAISSLILPPSLFMKLHFLSPPLRRFSFLFPRVKNGLRHFSRRSLFPCYPSLGLAFYPAVVGGSEFRKEEVVRFHICGSREILDEATRFEVELEAILMPPKRRQ